MIRATQYLPSILKLQQYLLSKHHHRSSHEQLKDERIIDIIRGAQNGESLFFHNYRNMKLSFMQITVCKLKRWLNVLGKHGI